MLGEAALLSEILSKRQDGRLSSAEAAELGRQACELLAKAHTSGVTHGSLSPSRIRLTGIETERALEAPDLKSLKVELEGFGEAQGASSADSSAIAEMSLACLSPQQLKGEGRSVAGDIYSLGATLYVCLSGKPPFSGPDLREQILRQPAPRLSSVPEWLVGAVAACLQKAVSLRPRSMADLRGRLQPPPSPTLAAPGRETFAPGSKASEKGLRDRLTPRRILGLGVFVIVLGLLWPFIPYPSKEVAPSPTPAATPTPKPTPEPKPPRFLDDIPHYVQIPAGTFQMGCVPADDSCEEGEFPRHEVSVRSFWMASAEVTRAAYEPFIVATRRPMPVLNNPDPEGAERSLPVTNVTWKEAREFCEWSGGRLPSEAEWEYAARGGLDGKKYPWGNEITHGNANYPGIDGRDRWANGAPVGSFLPNGFGLHDVAGNVWEWVEDSVHDTYESAPVDGRAWPGTVLPEQPVQLFDNPGQADAASRPWQRAAARIIRGGSHATGIAQLRVSGRLGTNGFNGVLHDVGFRCARSLPADVERDKIEAAAAARLEAAREAEADKKAEAVDRLIAPYVLVEVTETQNSDNLGGTGRPVAILKVTVIGAKDVTSLVGDLTFFHKSGKKLHTMEVPFENKRAGQGFTAHVGKYFAAWAGGIKQEDLKAVWRSKVIVFADGTTIGGDK